MILTSVNLTPLILQGLQQLVEQNAFPNRAEAIRTLLRDGLRDEFDYISHFRTHKGLYDFYKEFLKNRKVFKNRNLIVEYIEKGLNLSIQKYPIANFRSISQIFTKFTSTLEQKGFLVKRNDANANLYEIVNRSFLE